MSKRLRGVVAGTSVEGLEPRVIFAATGLASAGDVLNVSTSHDRVDFQLAGGAAARVEVDKADLVRIRVAPSGTFSDFSTGAIAPTGLVPCNATIVDSAIATTVSTADFKLTVFKHPFQITLQRPDGTTFLSDAQGGVAWDAGSGQIIDSKIAPPNEHYFGLGEEGGPIDRRGRTFFFRNTDNGGYSEFTDPLYSSFPFYYGVNAGQSYGVFLDNASTPFFDMDAEKRGLVTFGAAAGELNYYVMTGPAPAQVLQTYCRLTGFPSLPPEWTLGFQQSRYGYTSWAQVIDIARTFRDLQIPADAMWLDLNYTNKNHLFTWDPVNYANPVQNNAILDKLGFKRVNIVDSAIKTDDPLFTSLAKQKLLLTDGHGKPLVDSIFLGNVAWLDFSKAAARTWYKNHLKTFLQSGVSAVWNDLNEPAQNFMPTAVYDFDGHPRSDADARNLYALLETAATYQAQQSLRPNTRPWILSRSGYSGIQRYAAIWSGDTLSTWDTLRVNIEMSLSMGLSGIAQFGHDVGGFLGSPSGELFTRWLEFASMTPFFRDHSVNTSAEREPWDFASGYTNINRSVINQRYKLMPYLYTLFQQASQTGTSPLHPTFFDFPNDPRTYSQNAAFMLGPSLLVAPVYLEGARSRIVYLPAGTDWYDFHTGQLYHGGQSVTVPAPLDQVPMFVKAGAVLPSGPVVQNLENYAPHHLNVDVYGQSGGSFTLYQDDGSSTAYQRGVFSSTRIAAAHDAAGMTVSIAKPTGKMPAPTQSWTFDLHDIQHAPSSVTRNGVALSQVKSQSALNSRNQGWFYDAVNHQLFVRAGGSDAGLQIRAAGV